MPDQMSAEHQPAGVGVHFYVDDESDVPPYRQLVRQIRHALRLGLLCENDKLPGVKELAARLSINPNTVLKAYRELEYDGLVAGRTGVGTFVRVTIADAALAANGPVSQELSRWLATAREAGLDNESIEALVATMLRATEPGPPGQGRSNSPACTPLTKASHSAAV